MSNKDPHLAVGGQAVIEGVMMRSPKALVIAVRRPNGEVVLKEEIKPSWSRKFPVLGWPIIRGGVTLAQTLTEGMRALSYSANQALEEEEENFSPLAMAGTMAVAVGLAIAFFVILPHFLTLLAGRWLGVSLTADRFSFHLVDGILKVLFFLGYLIAISQWGDIKRVFEYHGAEHKSIAAYEKKKPLSIENTKPESTLHPRCGTAFLLAVLVISIIVFAMILPVVVPPGEGLQIGRQIGMILLKIVLILPIAGIGYEAIKLSGRYSANPLVRLVIAPGLLLQRITTKEPDDGQLEVAITALRRALELEGIKSDV